ERPIVLLLVDRHRHVIAATFCKRPPRNNHHHARVMKNLPRKCLLSGVGVDVVAGVETTGFHSYGFRPETLDRKIAQFGGYPRPELNSYRDTARRFISRTTRTRIWPFEIKRTQTYF